MSLTVGFACTCLVVSFLIGEGNVDSFHEKGHRIYEVSSNDPFSGGAGKLVFTLPATRDHLVNTFPEVENICQISSVDNAELEVGNNINATNLIAVDASFFTLFDFPLIAGSRDEIKPESIMISSEKAKQLFGTEDVLGKLVNLRTPDTTKILTITGVVGKANEKSHLRFDAIMSRALFDAGNGKNRPGGVTYVLLRNGTDPNNLVSKVNSDSLMPSLMGPGEMTYSLDALSGAYFNPANRLPFMQNRSETFVWIGWIVCGVILFMASFNFINLFLLSMQERRKETGIRKTLGVSMWQTLRDVGIEASIYVGISFLSALALAYTLLPLFNNALNADLKFDYFSRFQVLAFIGGAILFVALIAITLSTIQQRRTLPVSMMRSMSAKVKYSRLFFTIQFFVSITLCVCTITIVKQMEFLESEPLGFNRNIMQLNAPKKQSVERLGELKNLVSQIAGIEHVAQSNGNPISGNMIVYYELEDKSRFSPYIFSGDEDLLTTLDLKLVEGQLSIRTKGDHLVNETLVKKFNMKDPIGTVIPGTKDQRITGVVKDFTCSSFKQEIPPVIISYNETAKNILIDYGNNDITSLLPKIRTAWNSIFPDDYFDYKVIQNDLMKKYSEETLFYKVVLSASITSMVISCFGLFALSWAVIKNRAREMGIRKVLGASVADILALLTSSFGKRLLLAFILAAPTGYYLINLWLSRFVYKAPIDIWVFAYTAVCLAAIAIVTLGVQTLKASLSSPLEEIRE